MEKKQISTPGYQGPDRRVLPRPTSSFQRLLDIAFTHARKLK